MRALVGIAMGMALLAGCSSDSNSSGGGGTSSGGTHASGGSQSGGGTQSNGGSPSGGGTQAGGAGGSAGAGAGGGPVGGGGGGAGGSGGSTGVWHPSPGTTWQWQLTGTIDTSVDVAMFDIDLAEAPQAVIDDLHAKGRIVICYFSAGSREDWRDDAGSFAASDYGKGLQGWPGENWLDTRSANVRDIMKKRLDLAVTKKCDGVEPDNVDGYQNDSGFPLTEQTQLDYNAFLAQEAHARNLSVGLKNSVDLVAQSVGTFDWGLNEECLSFSECDKLAPFIQAGKAVFHVEYVDQQSDGPAKQSEVCGDPTTTGFSTLIKLQDLDAWRLACQ